MAATSMVSSGMARCASSMRPGMPRNMPWEARRKILLEVCGDVTDTEVIASNGELGELPTYLLGAP